MAPSHKFRAFTLIEILIVVVILGITAAAIIPQISSRDDLKVTAAARQLMSDLSYAQNRAISSQKMVYVQIDEGNQQYQVLTGLSPKTVLTHPLNKADYQVRFGLLGAHGLEDVQLASANFDGEKTIGFDEMGAPYSVSGGTGVATVLSQGTIDLKCGSARTLRVSVEPYTAEMSVTSLP